LPSLLQRLRESKPFEIIIADGGSSDRTCEVAESFGAKVVQSREKGRAVQMNAGAAKAQGDVFFFVHADTHPPKNFPRDMEQALQDGSLAGCYRSSYRGDQGRLRFNAWCTRFSPLFFRGGDQTLFVTRELFERVGGFDEYYCVMEDYEIIKALRRQTRFRIVPRDASISARKYDHNSFVRVTFANAIVFFLYTVNVEPKKLWKLYTRLIHHPKAE